LDLVRRPPCPSRLSVAIERGGLHLCLLIFVREQVLGEVDLTLLKLRAGGGANQRSHVGQHR